MAKRTRGRHRAPSRFSNAGTALTTAAKVTAVAATSGGLAATAFVPATAGPSGVVSNVAAATPVAETPAEQAISPAIATTGLTGGSTLSAVSAVSSAEIEAYSHDHAPVVLRPTDEPVAAVAAPDDAAERSSAYGALGFVGSYPEPEPEVAEEAPVREQTAASRSDARTEAPSTTATATVAAPEAAAPAVQAAPAASAGSGVLGVAAAYTGYPYAFAGNSPATGFDCSGYTSFVFAQVGVSLPRSAAEQQAYATPVSNPQPGDLIFFGYPAYHVGIYAGGGMMYDSGTPGTLTQYRAVFGGVSGYGRV